MFGVEVLLSLICFASFSVWLFNKREISVSIAIVFSFITFFLNYISYPSLLLIILFAMGSFFYINSNNKYLKFSIFILISVFIFIIMKNLIPDSKGISIFQGVKFSPISAPFSMKINIEKAVCGILLTAFIVKRCKSVSEWKKIIQESFIPLVVLVVVLMTPAILTNFVKFDYKIPDGMLYFILNNLLLTCVAEEVFFRGFLQKNLFDFLNNYLKMKKFAPMFSILIASIAFGYFHLYLGILMAIFAFVAGIGYGYAYQKSSKLESPILVHFGLNFIHFIFFTYPAYKP